MMELDAIDKKLLMLLQKDSKVTTKRLSVQLNLSTTAVYERIKKMERVGIVKKYMAVLDKEKVGKGFTVLCHVKLVQHSHEYLTKFEKDVVGLDEIVECFNVSGEYDYILKVVVKDMKAYRAFINEKINQITGI